MVGSCSVNCCLRDPKMPPSTTRVLLVLFVAPLVQSIRLEAAENASMSEAVSVLGAIGSLDSARCETKLKKRFCCGSIEGDKCKDGKRTPCDESRGMECDWTFRGRKCECKSNHCYDEETQSCVSVKSLPVVVGSKGHKSSQSVKVEDFFSTIGSGVVSTGAALPMLARRH